MSRNGRASAEMHAAIDVLAKAVPFGQLLAASGPKLFLEGAAEHIRELERERDTARAALEVATKALERLRDIAHDNRDWGMRTIAENALEAISRLAAPPGWRDGT